VQTSIFAAEPTPETSDAMASPQLITEMETKYPKLSVLRYRALAPLQIKLRDEKTTPTEFKFYADRLMRCGAFYRCSILLCVISMVLQVVGANAALNAFSIAGSWRRKDWPPAPARRRRW
jgi:hypothetical protein